MNGVNVNGSINDWREILLPLLRIETKDDNLSLDNVELFEIGRNANPYGKIDKYISYSNSAVGLNYYI